MQAPHTVLLKIPAALRCLELFFFPFVPCVPSPCIKCESPGDVLLFLTGEVEIEDACRAIRAEVEKSQDPDKVWCPLQRSFYIVAREILSPQPFRGVSVHASRLERGCVPCVFWWRWAWSDSEILFAAGPHTIMMRHSCRPHKQVGDNAQRRKRSRLWVRRK